jgi:hypothetical protein
MPKTLIVGNEEFEFPLTGENPGYSSEITDWAEAVTEALSTVQKPNDILTTTQAINNSGVLTNITGFSFPTSEVISIDCKYIVKRVITGGPNAGTYAEVGFIEGYYDGSNWGISIRTTGDAGILLSIDSSGQIQYIATPITGGSSYLGSITFEAKVINNI